MIALLLAACQTPDAVDTDVPVDCSTRSLDLPTPRGEVMGGWDPLRSRLVWFGGDEGTPVNCQSKTAFVGETWAWETDCGTFANLTTDVGPERRGRGAVATSDTTLYLHGGRTREGTSGKYTLLDDLWAFDFATDTWTLLAEEGPGARANHTLVLAGDRLILFGGNDSTDGASFSPLGDTWAYDLVTGEWSALETTDDLGERLFHAAATDGETMWVYGGGDERAFTGPFFGDLIALDLNTLAWREVHDSRQAPDARIWANLAYRKGELVMFGGHDDTALGNTNQLWTYGLADDTWREVVEGDVLENGAVGFCDFPADFVTPDLTAPERRNANVGALAPDGQLWIFGGKTDCGIINDVWSWDPDARVWTEASVATAGEICQRAYTECTEMCF